MAIRMAVLWALEKVEWEFLLHALIPAFSPRRSSSRVGRRKVWAIGQATAQRWEKEEVNKPLSCVLSPLVPREARGSNGMFRKVFICGPLEAGSVVSGALGGIGTRRISRAEDGFDSTLTALGIPMGRGPRVAPGGQPGAE